MVHFFGTTTCLIGALFVAGTLACGTCTPLNPPCPGKTIDGSKEYFVFNKLNSHVLLANVTATMIDFDFDPSGLELEGNEQGVSPFDLPGGHMVLNSTYYPWVAAVKLFSKYCTQFEPGDKK